MKNTQEKSLISQKNIGIFVRIVNFFKNMLKKEEKVEVQVQAETNKDYADKKEKFMEFVQHTENEETKLLELQRKYINGNIQENELTDEQVEELAKLFDKQIEELKKSNEIRKQKLMKYRKNI